MIPQGPNVHCTNREPHERHPNTEPGYFKDSWCDGVPPLEPFIELVVRVPLVGHLHMDGTHDEVVQDIAEEGLSTYVFDELVDPATRAALRVRWGGEDRVYPVVNGLVVRPDGKPW